MYAVCDYFLPYTGIAEGAVTTTIKNRNKDANFASKEPHPKVRLQPGERFPRFKNLVKFGDGKGLIYKPY
jgi:hypothetical protein